MHIPVVIHVIVVVVVVGVVVFDVLLEGSSPGVHEEVCNRRDFQS